ncbi:hypothetical protein [Acinetobacter gerneri]|jgi:hypothetical protein|uniref:hypothetical protein n=1 Tax=Acinetobacter gerneri TaxID=202952 RepID=UPI0023F4EC18|nr:hypothetical protein [Acinetobacter gerneri]MCH4245969.1 hypothetical protein [Acinetobacter gerneri]
MNTKPQSINPAVTHRVQPSSFIKVAAISGLFTVGVIGLAYNQKATEYKPTVVIPNTTPSLYSIQALKITSESSGVAVVKMDDFILTVPFYFEAHLDNYGVPGSEFTAVTINEVGEIKIKDINGHEYRDFTEPTEVTQIKELIRGYIEKNQLVELEVV